MKIYHNNTEFKKPICIEKTVNRLMNDLTEEQIYELASEIRKGIKKITGESITEWSGAFQVISDIAEACLSSTLNWDCIYLSDIHADLTYIQAQEIINQAAEHLGYVS